MINCSECGKFIRPTNPFKICSECRVQLAFDKLSKVTREHVFYCHNWNKNFFHNTALDKPT